MGERNDSATRAAKSEGCETEAPAEARGKRGSGKGTPEAGRNWDCQGKEAEASRASDSRGPLWGGWRETCGRSDRKQTDARFVPIERALASELTGLRGGLEVQQRNGFSRR